MKRPLQSPELNLKMIKWSTSQSKYSVPCSVGMKASDCIQRMDVVKITPWHEANVPCGCLSSHHIFQTSVNLHLFILKAFTVCFSFPVVQELTDVSKINVYDWSGGRQRVESDVLICLSVFHIYCQNHLTNAVYPGEIKPLCNLPAQTLCMCVCVIPECVSLSDLHVHRINPLNLMTMVYFTQTAGWKLQSSNFRDFFPFQS